MKKRIALLLSALLLLSLVACAPTQNGEGGSGQFADTPRAPEPFYEGRARIDVSVEGAAKLCEMLGFDTSDSDRMKHLAIALDTDKGEILLESSAFLGVLEYYLSPEKSSYTVEVDGNETETTLDRAGLYELFYADRCIGTTLSLFGDTKASKTYDKEKIDLISRYTELQQNEDNVSKTRTLAFNLTHVQLYNLLTDMNAEGKLDTKTVDFWTSFFDADIPKNAEELLISMKDSDDGDGEFGFSLRLTVSGDTVVLCDVAAKGADTQLSAVYDGKTGDVNVNAKDKSALILGDVDISSYEHTYEDGEETVTLSFEDKAQKTEENGIKLVSKTVKLTRKDGVISFSSSGKAERYDSSEAETSFSYRYDRTGNNHTVSVKDVDTATGEKINVKVTLSYGDGKLDCILNKDGEEYAILRFDTKEEGAYRVHTLSSVNVNGRDEDATGTGMKITVDLT